MIPTDVRIPLNHKDGVWQQPMAWRDKANLQETDQFLVYLYGALLFYFSISFNS